MDGSASIAEKTYVKAMEEAKELHGVGFSSFLATTINATDGEFYLRAETWGDLFEAARLRLR